MKQWVIYQYLKIKDWFEFRKKMKAHKETDPYIYK